MSKLEYSKEDLIDMQKDIDKLRERIERAIDYIKDHDYREDKCLHLFIFQKKELLEILGGEQDGL